MTVKERILIIRLVRKLEEKGSYSKSLGIEASCTRKDQKNKDYFTKA